MEEKVLGKYIAFRSFHDKEVIATGDDVEEVWRKAKLVVDIPIIVLKEED